MFKKIVVGVVFILALAPLFIPWLTLADGMLIAPPGRYVFESDQKGVIFFENGEERLILATSFKGDADDFAWVIPTPSKPEVKKSSAEIFTSLQSLTGNTRNEIMPDTSLSLGMAGSIKQGVQVIEKKSIEYYDVAVLASDDKDALADWLNNNGYHFPEQYNYVLQSYIDNNWIFTAVKFKDDINSQILSGSMRSGNLIPLELKFKTEKPVYPLKISSITEDVNAKTKLNYFSGLNGQAIELSQRSKLFTLRKTHDIKSGSLEMWVKPASGNLSHIDLLNFYDSTNPNRSLNFSIDGEALSMSLNNPGSTEYSSSTWTAGSKMSLGRNWNYVVITWKEGEVPKFYLNGNYVAPIPEIIFPEIKNDDLLRDVYVGSNRLSGSTINIYIDQIRLSSETRNEQEIVNNYNNGLGRELSYDDKTILVSSFDNNTKYTDKNGTVNSFITMIESSAANNYYKPSSVGIELYIFTLDKEQVLPGFNTNYAAWTDKKTIENLAMDDNGQPLIKIDRDKYYLTKLTRQMKYEEMNNDLFFRDAVANSDIEITTKDKIPFFIIIGLAAFISLTIITILIFKTNRD